MRGVTDLTVGFRRGCRPPTGRDGQPLSGKALARRRARVRQRRDAALVEDQLGHLDECLALVADQRPSVVTLLRWGLEHLGEHSVADLVRATGLSTRSVKTANQALLDVGLASFTDERSRAGYRRLWIFHLPVEDAAVADLGSVQRDRGGVAHSQDLDASALSCENELAVASGGVSAKEESVHVVQGEDADALPPSSPAHGHSVPSALTPATEPTDLDPDDCLHLLPADWQPPLATQRPKRPRSVGVDSSDPLWTDNPVLAAYQERIAARGLRVFSEQADGIAAELLTAQDEGEDDGLAFVDHLVGTARHPYLTRVVETFRRNWEEGRLARSKATTEDEVRMSMGRSFKAS